MSYYGEFKIVGNTATTTTNNKKLQQTSLKNDELILKLATSQDMTSTSKDDPHKSQDWIKTNHGDNRVEGAVEQ